MNVQEALNLYVALKRLETTSMPTRGAFAIMLNIKALTPVIETYECARIAFVQTHAHLDADGEPLIEDGSYKLKDERAFAADITALHEVKATVILQNVTLDLLPASTTPVELGALAPMLS